MPLRKNGKLIAEADITDWYEQTVRGEVEITDDAALFKLVDAGMPTGEITRHALVNQEVRGAPDLLGANKLLLYTGGRAALAEKIRAQRETVQINGAAYRLPKYVGSVREEKVDADAPENGNGHDVTLALDMEPGAALPDMPTTYTARLSEQGAMVAQEYLRRIVPGHIEPRLVMLREHGLDVRAAGDALKSEIDAMVRKLM